MQTLRDEDEMQLWHSIPVPGFCERMIGFSVPVERDVLLLTYDGLKMMHISKPITISTLDDHADPHDFYDPDTGFADYRGIRWELLGIHPGRPVLERPNGERLSVDDSALRISVRRLDATVWESEYENFSGDWVAATFSPDDWYILLGCPYDFDFRVWERRPDA